MKIFVFLVMLGFARLQTSNNTEHPGDDLEPTSDPRQRNSGTGSGTSSDWSYCSRKRPCREGQGDCDGDIECQSGLNCGDNTCRDFNPSAHAKADCCVKPAADNTCQEDCNNGWKTIGSYRFRAFSQRVTHDEAYRACAKLYGHLAIIKDFHTFAGVAGLIPSTEDRIWIGACKSLGKWRWDDGSSWTYAGWSGNSPAGGESCVEMGNWIWKGEWTQGPIGWNDVPCSAKRAYVCQQEIPYRITAVPRKCD